MNIPSSISGNRAIATSFPTMEGAMAEAVKSENAMKNALNITLNENQGVEAMTEDIELDAESFGALDRLFEKAFSLPPPPMPAELGAES